MIVSDLMHIRKQAPAVPGFDRAIHFLSTADIPNLQDGTIEIVGRSVFAIVQRYETAGTNRPRFECHRKYMDLQFISYGEEVIGWAPLELMTIAEPYRSDTDICFGEVPVDAWTPVHLQAGQLAIFWPEDAHAPKLSVRGPSSVMKVVVKVAVDAWT